MRVKRKEHLLAPLLLGTMLVVGLRLPTLFFAVQDNKNAGQIKVGELEPRWTGQREIGICDMLSMAYRTGGQAVLSHGRWNTTGEDALIRAKYSLSGLVGTEMINGEWKGWTLQDAEIVFRISSGDLRRRMLIWTMMVEMPGGEELRIVMDDQSGTVLGLSYRDPSAEPWPGTVPPTGVQTDGQRLMSWFTEYWGVERVNMSVIGDGGYTMTVTDGEGMTEIPFTLTQGGFQMNISK